METTKPKRTTGGGKSKQPQIRAASSTNAAAVPDTSAAYAVEILNPRHINANANANPRHHNNQRNHPMGFELDLEGGYENDDDEELMVGSRFSGDNMISDDRSAYSRHSLLHQHQLKSIRKNSHHSNSNSKPSSANSSLDGNGDDLASFSSRGRRPHAQGTKKGEKGTEKGEHGTNKEEQGTISNSGAIFSSRYDLSAEELVGVISSEPESEPMKEFLQQFTWPVGLQNAFVSSLRSIPIRFFVIDDSGSMLTNDGKKLQGKGTATE